MKRPKKWDVFTIPVPGKGEAYGHVLIPGHQIFIVVYKELNKFPTPDTILDRQSVALCGRTEDARIYHKLWKAVGNVVLRNPDFIWPYSKISHDGNIVLRDFFRNDICLISKNDAEMIDFETSSSPIRFDKALAALHGIAEWNPSFDKITYDHMETQTRNGMLIAKKYGH